LDPCKAIATLQIARDLRNDTSVQLSSYLVNLPADIQEACVAANSNNNNDEFDAATIRDYSMRIPSKFLDLDLQEQVQTIQTFQELVKKQQAARQKLIYLLLKSRCQFGSQTAARNYFQLQETSQKLQRRKQLLSDALELEGLDAEIVLGDGSTNNTNNFEKELDRLPPLSWYQPAEEEKEEEEDDNKEDASSIPSASKKARIDSSSS
jgi:hypothetical protein